MKCAAALLVCCLLLAGAPAHAQDAGVLYQQGVEARQAGKFEEAVNLLQAAAKLLPDDADIQVQLGLALTALQRFDEAKTAFQRALELAPDYVDAKLGLARIDYFARRYTEARAAVEAILKDHPDNADAVALLAQIDKAAAAPAPGPAPPSAAAELKDKGIKARVAGNFADAVKLLTEAAKLSPNDADIQVELGLALTALKRFEEAKAAFQRALELVPDYVDAKLGLARLDYFAGRYKEARAAVEAILKDHPDNADAIALLAQIKKAESAPPPPSPAAVAMKEKGIAARKAGKFQDAVKLLTEAAKLLPNDADIQVELGLAYTALKRYAEAKAAFERALELVPGYVDAKLGLARLDYFAKRYSEARAAVLALLRQQPGNKDAKDLLASINKAMAAAAEAEQAAKKAAELEALKWKLDLNGGWSGLTGPRPDWAEGDARLSYKLNSEYTVSGFFDQANRFGVDNTLLEGRIEYRPGPIFSDYAFVAGSPNASFFPQIAVGAGFTYKLRDAKGLLNASVATMDARYAHYVTGPVRVFNPGLEQYLFNGRFWITARMVNVIDQDNIYSRGYLLRGDWQMTDKWRIFGGWADAPENVNANIVRTHSIFGGLIYDMDDRTSWRVAVGHDDRVGLFKQILVGAGVSRRF